eukprot:GHVL01012380.1.p1 GENE.GHVL01012380.1~~GHVL01012380.1.p1  ORF type:complete len:283 (+),score=60.36 GHVL01012380.1:377-1225(+)
MDEIPSLSVCGDIIGDESSSIERRMRALNEARAHGSNPDVVSALNNGLKAKSVLLRHECAFVMGQVGCLSAVSILQKLLSDMSENEMVRHEAAEALAAIGDRHSLQLIESYIKDESEMVAETCQLAARSLKERDHRENSVYKTVDPAVSSKIKDIKKLIFILNDKNAELWDRYEALFALRDLGTDEAAKAISDVLVEDKSSALFRHEVAYVLGQLQNVESIDKLHRCVEDETEAPIVRHEAAIALGSVGTQRAQTILEKFVEHKEDVVRESALVGLDIYKNL